MTRQQLARRLYLRLMIDLCQWQLQGKPGSHRGARFRRLLNRYGGVGTMKKLLNSKTNSQRKPSTFEAERFIKGRYLTLFTTNERRVVRQRRLANQ